MVEVRIAMLKNRRVRMMPSSPCTYCHGIGEKEISGRACGECRGTGDEHILLSPRVVMTVRTFTAR